MDARARPLGRAGAANTLGAVAGALLAGFAALPALGCAPHAAGRRRRPRAGRTGPPLARLDGARPLAGRGRRDGVGCSSLPTWRPPGTPRSSPGGPYKYAAYATGRSLEDELRAGELVFYRDGRVATVSVKRLGGTLSLAVDGKVDATSAADMLTQRLLAHLPLLLHGGAQDVCVIGLGSGVTAGSALAHPVRTVEAVEISPEVAQAARLFTHVNRGALDDPRLRLVIGDGRHHLQHAREGYDVVISEPSNPWMAGVASLFTRDFFTLARSRLRPGGLLCQWAHVYNMSPRDLRTVVGSFTDAFPEAALFLVNEGDVLLVGARDELPTPSAESLAARLARPQVREDLAGVEVRTAAVLGRLFALSGPALAAWAGDAPRHTDDRPRLEFSTPRFLHADTAAENRRLIREAAATAPWPEPFASLRAGSSADTTAERARMLEASGGHGWAFETFGEALAQSPTIEAAEGLARTALRLGRTAEAEERLRLLAAGPAPVAGRVGLGLLAHNRGQPGEALAHLAAAAERDPGNRRVLLLGAEVQQAAGNLEAAEGLAQSALALDPGDPEAESLLAAVALAAGKADEAGRRAEAVLARAPKQTQALEVAAIVRAGAGDRAGARRAFEALLQAEPDGWGALTNYGVFELKGGDARAAAALFRQAVTLHPGNAAGYRGLAEAAQVLGDSALAAQAQAGLQRLGAPPP